MSNLHEQIELLRAELRNCIDRGERNQILAELEAAIREAEEVEQGGAADFALDDRRPE